MSCSTADFTVVSCADQEFCQGGGGGGGGPGSTDIKTLITFLGISFLQFYRGGSNGLF